MGWLLSQDQAPIIGVIGLSVTTLGFFLAAWGLWKTYERAAEAVSAADSAKAAVGEVQIKIDSYSAFRDVNEALISMESCKKHLRNQAWGDASDVYEAAHRAVVRLNQSDIDFGRTLSRDLSGLASHMKAFCDDVDAAEHGKGSYPDRAKVLSAIRNNYIILSATNTFLEKQVIS